MNVLFLILQVCSVSVKITSPWHLILSSLNTMSIRQHDDHVNVSILSHVIIIFSLEISKLSIHFYRSVLVSLTQVNLLLTSKMHLLLRSMQTK